MTIIFKMPSSYGGLADLQAAHGFQYFESRIPFSRRLWQLSDSSRNTNGVTARCLSCQKPGLWSVNLDYDHHHRGRGRQSLPGQRKVDILRGLESSRPLGAERHRAMNSESASTKRTTTETVQEQQISKSESIGEDVEQQGAGARSGLSALDAYFSKLRGNTEIPGTNTNASKSSFVSAVVLPVSKQDSAVASARHNSAAAADAGEHLQGLQALDAYFDKLNPKRPEPKPQEQVKPTEETVTELTDEEIFMKSLIEAKEDYERYRSSMKDQGGHLGTSSSGDMKFQVTTNSEVDFPNWELPEEQTGNSNLINVLVAVNIAVYLFGLASPHEALGFTDSSLPIVYGAKVNDLIVAGQWWRFITPMFLHASLLHIGLGSWALLSFGPAVESAYGTLGFSMIYLLGGLFGDLTSFFHTSEWTVGGTGPIYALVGCWVVYLLKNREIIGKEIADDMIRKVVILSAVNVALCNSLPIDDWTHLGALLIGTAFGILASPTMQMNVTVKESDKENEDAEAYLWFNDGASPARLTLIFALCLGIFFILYQLSISGSNDMYLLQDMDDFS